MAVTTSNGDITPKPSGVHADISSPSLHKMLISLDILSWNVLCKNTPSSNNNGFGVTESGDEYKARLKWIAESIAETLANHPSIKNISLQEVPTDPIYLKLFQESLASALKNKGLSDRFPIALQKNTFFEPTGTTPQPYGPQKSPQSMVQLQPTPSPKTGASANPLTLNNVTQEYANASLTPSFPKENTTSKNETSTFTPTLEADIKKTSENTGINTTLDKTITQKRAEKLWSSIKEDPDFKKNLENTIRGMGGKPYLTYDLKDKRKGLKSYLKGLVRNKVVGGYRNEGDFEAITLTEGLESDEFLGSFEKGKQLSHWLSAEDKVDIGFDKVLGKMVVTSHATSDEGTPNTKVLAATSFAIANKEYQLLVQEKTPEIIKKYKEQHKNLDEDPNKWPPDILEKVQKEAESLITQAEKDQIYSFNISYCESYKNLLETLQGMAACTPPLTAKLSKNVETWLKEIGKDKDPSLMTLLEKTKPPHKQGAKTKTEATEEADSMILKPGNVEGDNVEGAGSSLKQR